MENNAAVVAALPLWLGSLACLKFSGGGPLELLEVAENGRFAW